MPDVKHASKRSPSHTFDGYVSFFAPAFLGENAAPVEARGATKNPFTVIVRHSATTAITYWCIMLAVEVVA